MEASGGEHKLIKKKEFFFLLNVHFHACQAVFSGIQARVMCDALQPSLSALTLEKRLSEQCGRGRMHAQHVPATPEL